MNRRILVFLLLIGSFVLGEALAQEPPNVIEAYRNEPYGDGVLRKRGIMDGNLVRTLYYNQGEVGHWPDQPSGEWPKGTGHSYLDGVSVLVGAQVVTYDANGNPITITPVEAGYREHMDKDPVTGEDWGWEPVPGYMNETYDTPAISNNARSWPDFWPDAIFQAIDQDPLDWINQPEVDGEPGVDDDRDGDIDNFTYWLGYFGRGVKNADVETFYVMDDSQDGEWARPPYNYFPIESDHDRGGLGLRVEVRGFQWSHVLAEDCIFWLYDIVNISDGDYNTTAFGFLTDVGVGGTNDSGDDSASFDLFLDIAYAFDEDGQGSSDFGQWSPTGLQGYAYLESPGKPYDGIDNDEDGIVDERRDDGIDNDEDWAPYGDLNGNGEWDPGEPLNDDLGKDGVGPYDRQYNGPDDGEADGIPTDGEPDFDRTDIDESDQIGLNSMHIYRLIDGGGGDGWPKHDDGLWTRMISGTQDTSLHRSNLHMLFASGPFELRQNTRERFSMALLYGINLDDLVSNKITVQQIYNANYNFSRPPFKPYAQAVASDGKVYLFWDDIAEESRDPFLPDSVGNPKKDFEGYMIYRSREPQFNDIKTITDSRGTPVYWKPIAQYDLVNGILGPDPVGINGASFWRGSDTGLRHSYVDEDVTNGVTYYYAVVSYDQGDPEFGEQGLQPTECSKVITEDLVGNIKNIDLNCAVVTPNAPAAGYIPPEITGDMDQVKEGIGTGSLNVSIVDAADIRDNTKYQVVFEAEGESPDYMTSSYSIYRIEGGQQVPIEENIDATTFGPDNPSPIADGFVMTVDVDTSLTVIPGQTGWLIGDSNIDIEVLPHTRFPTRHQAWPADYKIEFYDEVVSESYNYDIPATFKIINTTESREVEFEIFDEDDSGDLTMGDIITIIEFVGNQFKFVYDINYFPPFNAIPRHPEPGDEYVIRTAKPFQTGDYFEFSTQAATTDFNLAKDQLKEIKVVPNPYIAGASWEPRLVFGAGRGERKIDFIHLPAECTIRIYTMSGKLVKRIDHLAGETDGTQSWDLISDDGMDIAYGVYVYHIDAPNIGEHIGKFAVVK